MANEIKVPMEIQLRAGDVLVAVSEDSHLWSFVMGAILNPPDYTLPPLPPGFLASGYRSLP